MECPASTLLKSKFDHMHVHTINSSTLYYSCPNNIFEAIYGFVVLHDQDGAFYALCCLRDYEFEPLA